MPIAAVFGSNLYRGNRPASHLPLGRGPLCALAALVDPCHNAGRCGVLLDCHATAAGPRYELARACFCTHRTPRTCAPHTERTGRRTPMIDSAAMDLVNVSEAARRLGVSRKTVHRRIDAGELVAIDTPDGKRVRIRDERTPAQAQAQAHHDAQEGTPPAAHPPDADLITELRADRDAWREQAQGLRDTVERLSENVSELNRTLQGQTVRLAQLEGRVLTAQTPQEPPETVIRPDTTPVRSTAHVGGLRGLYMRLRGVR